MKVVCDKCKKEFEVEHKTEYLGAMITETYFKCTHCSEKYIVILDNCKTRKLKRHINSIKDALQNNLIKKAAILVMTKKFNSLVEKHKVEMKRMMKGEYSWRYQAK